jgi:hypothetical protein
VYTVSTWPDLPEFDRAILDGPLVVRGHQGFETGQVGKQCILMEQGIPALLLQILECGQGTGEIVRKLLPNVLVYPVSDDEQTTAGDCRSHCD